MIHIISGTNRPNARSLEIAKIVQNQFHQLSVETNILDLSTIDFSQLDGSQYSENQPEFLSSLKKQINESRGLYFITPEYNGSFPGILKYFIDHWSYPETFEYRPVAFLGLGGRFGGLRSVEHLQQIMGYRNAYQFPERVFISNVWNVLKDEQLLDDNINSLLIQQVRNFSKYVLALESQKLDANSHLAAEK